MIIWRGWGIVVAVIAFAGRLAREFVDSTMSIMRVSPETLRTPSP